MKKNLRDIEERLAYAAGQGDQILAIECLKELFEKKPEARYLGGIASRYEQLSNHSQAIKYGLAAVELDPLQYTSICALARAYYHMGNHPAACKYIEKGLSISQDLRVLWMPVILDALCLIIKDLFTKSSPKSHIVVDEDWVAWAKSINSEICGAARANEPEKN